IAIGLIGIGLDHHERAAWSWFLLTGNCCLKKGNERSGRIERADDLARLINFDPAARQFGLIRYIGDKNNYASPIEFLSGIQRDQQLFAHMKLLGDGFPWTGVVEGFKLF